MVCHSILETEKRWEYKCCRSQEYQASDEYQNTLGKSILTCLQFDVDVNSAVEAQKSGYDIRKLCHVGTHGEYISHHIVKPAGASAIIGCSTIGHRQLGNGQQQEKHGWNLDFILHTK